MKAIIVARVSTEEQKEAGNSLPAQIIRMQDYCERNGHDVVETFSFDESAYKTKRDEFDKIIDCINGAKEKIAVCFDKVDRLSRNIFDKRVAWLYEKAVEDEIELHFVSDNQVIHSKISAGDKFMFGMKLGLSKYYSDAISDNTKRALEQRRRNGEFSSRAPLGYKNVQDEDGKKTIIADEERRHIVVRLFEMYSTGNYSMETLRQESIRMGLRSHSGRDLYLSTIEVMLKNPFYCGIALYKKTHSYPHKYPRLITRELFDKCQEVRDGKRMNHPKFIGQEFVFKGLIHCKNCGCLLSPEIHKKKSGLCFIYYSCTNSKRICEKVYVPEKTFLKPIYDVLERFEGITEERQNEIVDELRANREAEVVYHQAQINRIRSEYDHVKQKDDRLLDAYLEQSINKDIYEKKHQECHNRLQILNIELEEHTKADYDYQNIVAIVFAVARRAKAIFDGSEPAEKRAFVNYLIQNPIANGKNLEFTLRSPFNAVLELTNSPVRGG